MNILSLDTCCDACSVAAGRGLRSLSPAISSIYEPMQTGHAERIVPMIGEVLSETGMRVCDLDKIVVTIGPGTFAGTRISVSAARALRLACDAELIGITSLRLMAMNPVIPAHAGTRLAIVTDARRGQVYLQEFDRHSLEPRCKPVVIALADVAGLFGSDPVVFAGNGAELCREALAAGGGFAEVVAPDLLPDAIDSLFAAFSLPPATAVEPLYLRQPDAKPPAPNVLLGTPA